MSSSMRLQHASRVVAQRAAAASTLRGVRVGTTATVSASRSMASRTSISSASSASSASFHTASRMSADSQQIGAMLSAASLGEMRRLEQLLADGSVDVNDGDYDRRRPLHLAAAEGRIDVVRFLLSRGADLHAEDRWGNTALDEALTGRQDEVIQFLRSVGAHIGKARMADMGNILCQASSEGNVQHLQRLVSCGVDVNTHDYDNRTALHVASSEGHVSTVEFLLRHGANVNSVDRFGNTPLGDATRSRARNKKAVVEMLMKHGAQLESADHDMKTDPFLQGSILRSLPFISQRSNAVHVEAWLPNEEATEFVLLESSSYTSKDFAAQLKPFTASTPDSTSSNNPHTLLGRAWNTKDAVFFHDITEKDMPVRWQKARECGLKSGFVVPLLENDQPYAVLKLYFTQNSRMEDKELEHFKRFVSGVVSAGVYRKGRLPPFAVQNPDLPKNQMEQVYSLIVSEEVFNPNLVYFEVDWFYSLGLQKYYFERFSAAEIANHIHAFIAAKKVAATTGLPEDILLNIESKAGDKSLSWLFMCPIEHSKQVGVEKRIQSQINKIASTHNKSYTLEFFMSERPIVPCGTKQMGLYVLETSEWNNPATLGKATETRIEDIASSTFLRTKSTSIVERYQSLLSNTVNKLSPLAAVFPTYRDGTLPIMFAFYMSTGTTTSYMLQLTELLKSNNLVANRKFIETFANGVIVYSLYLQQPAPKTSIDALLKQFSMLHLVPESSLTPRFLNGEYTAEQYTYNSAASRFVYYFLNKRSEEFDVLAKSMKGDPLNLGRLRLLQTRLKREAVSLERIYACFANHASVMQELFKDFYRVCTVRDENKLAGRSPTLNADILTRIKNEATTVLDQQILTALLTFNAHLLKTNFYNKTKSSLSFRLDPRFLVDSDWPSVPFGVFFVMGSDFQGFHIRFQDIARGGIRIIRSGDRQSYNTNLETLFTENYGLAYTQNKKNKDIPEFGSKGTVLLSQNNQSTPFLSFQKYVSGLLDLLIDSEDIFDNYGKQEILFLGPDEGTADYMEWAARYAAKRGYPYWRAFTTGKPPSLGGIPHDRFGMTTRSVHRYVLGCLEKCGLKEEEVTKFQTGGPDGDLGSNEILLSKDRTKAVVDGSGVVYDPNGLDRDELQRLAHKRVMIREFETSKLGPGGFRVLITDTNVTLPTGEVIDSGLAFRNEFHLHPLSSADLFVPCGGRPESVNLTNVGKLFDAKGQPRFKIIVEGANLFFTQDARMVLENAGVVLYKDASANKGGVTSSSLEVLAALAIPSEMFEEHMCVKDDVIPAFYDAYVKEIQHRIEQDAGLEFQCIWNESQKTNTPRYLLTDAVSDKINNLNDFIQRSSLWKNTALRERVLAHAIPQTLQDLLGLEAILKRVPDSYMQAIFGAYLASRFVYKHGLDTNEMAFFEFMQPFLAEALASGSGGAASKKKKSA